MKRSFLVTAIAALGPSLAWAQAEPTAAASQPPAAATIAAASFDFADLDIEAVLGEVRAASGKVESLFVAPATVTVLDASYIRRSAARSVPDLLRGIPGMQVVQIAPGNYAVSVRGTGGLQSNNLIVVLDGVPMNNPFDGSVDWAAFPASVDEIERIELARGPVSPIFGADAFTGVVVITTRAPGAGEELAFDGIVGGGGSGPTVAALGSGTLSATRGGSTAWRLSAHGTHDDAFGSIADPALGRHDLASQPAAQQAGALGRLTAKLASASQLEVAMGAGWSRASATDSLVIEPLAQQSRSAHLGAELTVDQLLGTRHRLVLAADARYLDRSADLDDYDGAFSYDDLRSYRARATGGVAFELPANAHLDVGLETSVVDVSAPFIHPDENGTARFTHAARIHADVDLGRTLILEAALRGDWSAFAEEPQSAGRASVIFYRDWYSLRATAAYAYRNPTYIELAGRFIDPATELILLEGSPDLEPPKNQGLEVAGIFGLAGGKLTLRPTVFVQRLTNLVVGDFTPLVRKSFRNDERSIDVAGGEIEADWTVAEPFSVRLSGSALRFLSEQDDPAATVGESDHNSGLMGRVEGRLKLLDGALFVTGAASYTSGREYNVRAGIPPLLLPKYETGDIYRFELAADWRPLDDTPLAVQLKAAAVLPFETVDAAYPLAGELGSRVFAGVSYGL